MRLRAVALCFATAAALGAGPAAAQAATPVLWLRSELLNERVKPGTEAFVFTSVEGCGLRQSGAKVVSNGMATDHVSVPATTPENECPAGEKRAGGISGVGAKPATGDEMTLRMTSRTAIHLFVEPWCTYALPLAIAFPAALFTESEGTVGAPLDKAASFGSCAATRTVHLRLVVIEVFSGHPFSGEVVG